MPISESMVQDIVQEVMAKMQIADAPAGKHGIFTDMNEAIEAAKASQKIVRKMSLDQREKIITCIRRKTKENAVTQNMFLCRRSTGMPYSAEFLMRNRFCWNCTMP